MLDRLIDVLVQFIDLFRFWTVVRVYEGVVRLRLGTNPVVLAPGFHWIAPFRIDHLLVEWVVPRIHGLPPQTVTVRAISTASTGQSNSLDLTPVGPRPESFRAPCVFPTTLERKEV